MVNIFQSVRNFITYGSAAALDEQIEGYMLRYKRYADEVLMDIVKSQVKVERLAAQRLLEQRRQLLK